MVSGQVGQFTRLGWELVARGHTLIVVYCVFCPLFCLWQHLYTWTHAASAKESTQQYLFTELQRLKEEAEEKGESTQSEQSVFFYLVSMLN